MCTIAKSYKIYIFYVHTTFLFFLAFILLSLCPSPYCLSISSFFLHRTFFLPQRPIADLHEPSRHKPITTNPRSAANLTHFGLSSLFSAFRLCVLGCACVLALCFGLCLCFGFVFRARFLFRAWVCVSGCDFSTFSFLFFFTGFDGHGGVVVVQ